MTGDADVATFCWEKFVIMSLVANFLLKNETTTLSSAVCSIDYITIETCSRKVVRQIQQSK